MILFQSLTPRTSRKVEEVEKEGCIDSLNCLINEAQSKEVIYDC